MTWNVSTYTAVGLLQTAAVAVFMFVYVGCTFAANQRLEPNPNMRFVTFERLARFLRDKTCAICNFSFISNIGNRFNIRLVGIFCFPTLCNFCI